MAPASAPALSLWSRTPYIPQSKPADVIWTLVNLVTIAVLAVFTCQKVVTIRSWQRVPFAAWMVLAIYIDSFCFVLSAAIVQKVFGVNSSLEICQAAILLCLIAYMSTKLFIYIFLVEKVHIIRSSGKPRMKSRLYLFNSFGMLSCFLVIVTLNFIYRYARMENGQCIIGMRTVVLLPLLAADVIVNIYLTVLFLIPLKSLYSFNKSLPKSQTHLRLRNAALRTFIGSCCTLISSVANLTLMISMGGEPGWMCLMCCNIDILFSAVVIYWVTSRDGASSDTQSRSSDYQGSSRRYGTRSSTVERRSAAPILGSSTGTASEAALPASDTRRSGSDSRSTASLVRDGCNFGPSSGVIVTTTIQCQSRSGSFGNDMGDIKGGAGIRTKDEELAYGLPPQQKNFTVGYAEVTKPPRTCITSSSKKK